MERIHQGDALPRSMRHGLRPYATIPMTLVGSSKLRELSITAVRVLWWCDSSWTPANKCVAPVRYIAGEIGKRPAAVSEAIHSLIVGGFLILAKAARRPGCMMGSTRGVATVFDLPHRHKGAQIERRPGDRTIDSFWRVYADDLRLIVSDLSDAALRALVTVVLPHHRLKNGTLRDDVLLDLSPSSLMAALPGVSRRTATRAVDDLLEAKLIVQVQPANGRRAATYAPAGAAIQRITRGRAKKVKVPQPESNTSSGAGLTTRMVRIGTQSHRKPDNIMKLAGNIVKIGGTPSPTPPAQMAQKPLCANRDDGKGSLNARPDHGKESTVSETMAETEAPAKRAPLPVQWSSSRKLQLPPDWQPGADYNRFAMRQGFNDQQTDAIAIAFRSHWIALAEAKAKIGWYRAWQAWVLDEAERTPASKLTPLLMADAA